MDAVARERSWHLGVEDALRKTREDIRYPLSVAEPLQVLVEEFGHSENHMRKVMEIGNSGFAHRRRVRGDGNCFYRAACFAWLEALVARAARGKAVDMPLPCGWPEASLFGGLEEEYRFLRSSIARLRQSPAVGQELLVRLLTDYRLDLCIVSLLRLVASDFLAQFAAPARRVGDSLGNLVRASVAEKVSEHGSIENYVRAEVLPLGREAEGAGIYAAAVQLGAKMRILQLDGTSGPLRQYVYPCEDYEGPMGIKIHLLFRPGHYELLYAKEGKPFLWGAPLMGRCSFCHERAELRASALLPCFHRLCESCGRQTSKCPNCAEFLPTGVLNAPDLLAAGLEETSSPSCGGRPQPVPSGQAEAGQPSPLPPKTLSPRSALSAFQEARTRLGADADDSRLAMLLAAESTSVEAGDDSPRVAVRPPVAGPAEAATPRTPRLPCQGPLAGGLTRAVRIMPKPISTHY